MVDSVPALAASRLYLYLSKGADDLTMTLWSTLATTQLQIFAAHACTNGFVITKRMSSVVSHFGLANQAIPSGPTEAHHARTTMSSRKSVHQRMSVSDRFLPRGDEAMGTILLAMRAPLGLLRQHYHPGDGSSFLDGVNN
jgi:hypothetical protein